MWNLVIKIKIAVLWQNCCTDRYCFSVTFTNKEIQSILLGFSGCNNRVCVSMCVSVCGQFTAAQAVDGIAFTPLWPFSVQPNCHQFRRVLPGEAWACSDVSAVVVSRVGLADYLSRGAPSHCCISPSSNPGDSQWLLTDMNTLFVCQVMGWLLVLGF